MPVIVHNSLIANALDIEAWTSRPERPETNRNAKNPIDRRVDRQELRKRAISRHG